MWLNVWCSAWPEPSDDDAHPSCRVRLDPKFIKVATTTAPPLMMMPEDVLTGLTKMVLLMDAKGSRFGRTCKAAYKLFCEVTVSFVSDGVAWWTGSGEPFRPLSVPDLMTVSYGSPEMLDNAAKKLKWHVYGIDGGDIERILSGWLTNFSIDCILVAMGCPIVLSGGSYVARPVEGMLVLSAQLGGLSKWGHLEGAKWSRGSATITFPRTSFWGREDVVERINTASILIIPLNIGDNHWVAIRVVKVRALAHSHVPLTCIDHAQCTRHSAHILPLHTFSLSHTCAGSLALHLPCPLIPDIPLAMLLQHTSTPHGLVNVRRIPTRPCERVPVL